MLCGIFVHSTECFNLLPIVMLTLTVSGHYYRLLAFLMPMSIMTYMKIRDKILLPTNLISCFISYLCLNVAGVMTV